MSHEIDGVPHITAESAAAVLGTTKLRILILIKEKRLSGTMREGQWYVTRASVEAFREEEYPAPVATACRTGCSGCGCH